MNDLKLKNTEIYIEETGLFYERYGLPKMAGRILGYLISSETNNNSFSDLKEALKASKGSISSNLKVLLNQKMIEKHMLSGDRKAYYQMGFNDLQNILETKTKSVSELRLIFKKGLDINTDKDSLKHKTLSEILMYYEFLEEEIPLLKNKWEQKLKWERKANL